jgi:uncharacterized membrane protein YbhN (UPF0104 family)
VATGSFWPCLPVILLNFQKGKSISNTSLPFLLLPSMLYCKEIVTASKKLKKKKKERKKSIQ